MMGRAIDSSQADNSVGSPAHTAELSQQAAQRTVVARHTRIAAIAGDMGNFAAAAVDAMALATHFAR